MAALFSPVFLLFSAIVSSVKITCKSAHWPLTKKSCELSHHTQLAHPSGGLKYDHQFFIESTADVDLPPELAAMWNVSLRSARTDAWRCSHEHKCSVFVLLPHDPSQYGSAGSNYYVFHVDILLPVWNHINFKMSCGAGAGMKDISVFVFHMQSNRILWDSDIFRSSDTFWTQSFRLLFGDNFKPFTLDSFRSLHDRDVAAAVATEGTAGMSSPLLCFHTVSLGVPEFSSPSKKAVQSMAQLMRQKIFDACGRDGCRPFVHPLLSDVIAAVDTEGPARSLAMAHVIEDWICRASSQRVGLITRKGRRRITNEMALLEAVRTAIPSASIRLIDFGVREVSHVNYNGSDFSAGASMMEDLLAVQDLAVLIGFQGSGLINGLYTSKVTAVAAIYSSYSWPLASGDPLELISHRGPYHRHVCSPGSCVMQCEVGTADQFCDSGDVEISENEFLVAVRAALKLHHEACAASMSSSNF